MSDWERVERAYHHLQIGGPGSSENAMRELSTALRSHTKRDRDAWSFHLRNWKETIHRVDKELGS